MHTIAFVKSVLFQAAESREERGAAFTEYVVLLGAVVAFVLAVGFGLIQTGLTSRITDIAGKI
ncbi:MULTISPECIES: hypothetical protein [Aeromicrobium]|uniref:hypothetical protein n=1 Tax=Aeromicrobium TaxID=2040 RepID=UPI0006FC905D|nr:MULTISPECIES: hypothetical protein [Aeromicrobium]KQX71857.1 hypothetical protein ASD10_18055 [Aeromicrobium sp. Root472D3]MCL8252711.1 hypothetical protein [Aeromicrobium fastidiosum]